MDIQAIIDAMRKRRIRITDHADEEATNDGLILDEIYESVLAGEVIEDYPTDKPYPSCLIFGLTTAGRPVHSVWAYDEESLWSVLVTVYVPDPAQWIDWRERRPRS